MTPLLTNSELRTIADTGGDLVSVSKHDGIKSAYVSHSDLGDMPLDGEFAPTQVTETIECLRFRTAS